MMLRQICLAGAAVAALSCGIATTAEARSKAEEDAITRQLNLDQLAKAQASRGAPPTQAPARQDGQGGPELQGPPTPDEGMADDVVDDTVDDMKPDVPEKIAPPEPVPNQPPAPKRY